MLVISPQRQGSERVSVPFFMEVMLFLFVFHADDYFRYAIDHALSLCRQGQLFPAAFFGRDCDLHQIIGRSTLPVF